MGRGNRQRIEHSSDLPPSYSHRLESHDVSHDDNISGAIFKLGASRTSTMPDSVINKTYDRSKQEKPTIMMKGSFESKLKGGST